MIDFNHSVQKFKIANDAINTAIDNAIVKRMAEEEGREYLGASSLGHDCLRKIQFDWRQPVKPQPRTKRIFDRGHWWEAYCVELMQQAGFRFVRNAPRVGFSQLGGKFKGHGDGMIIAGPEIEGLAYSCLWEAKGLGSKGWTKLSKEGLNKAYPGYADQVALYQAYFDLTENPAIFTACNLDTMEILHLLVPFDPERAQAASDRAVTVIRADEAGELLPRIGANADDWRCKMCSHKTKCWPE
jgi:hypothetical protein